jgi:hypothetical protein
MTTATLIRSAVRDGDRDLHRPAGTGRFYGWAVPISILLAIASMWIISDESSLGYDPWSWTAWGKELAHGALSTAGASSSIKPLPVFIDAGLSVLGSNAPWAWLVIARAGFFLALLLAFRLAMSLSSGRWVAGIFAAAAVTTVIELLGYIFFQSYSDELEVCLALCAVDLLLSRRRWATLLVLLVASLSRIEMSAFLIVYVGWCLWRYDRRVLTVVTGAAALALVAFGWLGLDLISSGDAFRSATRAQFGNPGRPIFQAHPFVIVLWEGVDDVMFPVTVAFGAEMVRGVAVGIVTRRLRPTLLLGVGALCWVAGEGLMAQLHLATGSAIYLSTGLAAGGVVAAVFVGDLLALSWHYRRRFGPALAAAAIAGTVVGTVHHVTPAIETARSWWNSERAAYSFSIPGAQQDAQVAAAVRVAGGRRRILACGPIVQASSLSNPVIAWALDIPLGQVSDNVGAAPGVSFITGPPPPHALPAGAWSIVEHC